MTAWDENEGHPGEGTLLLYLDGELPSKEAALVQAHLTACWSCRMNADRVQEAVFAFIEYRTLVLRPFTAPPPSNEQKFMGRLQAIKDQLGKRSWLARLSGSWSWSASASRLATLPRPLVWTASGLTVALVAIALITWLDHVPVVTASELLQKASEAQARELRARGEPVIYQKLQVKRGRRTATWDLWCDTVNARFRQSVRGTKERTANHTDEAALLTELNEVLRTNRMNPQRPLSPTSFQAWRQSLTAKREEVSRLQTGDGEMLRLRVLPIPEPSTGQITEATLVVRAQDWHPMAQTLKVRVEKEIRDYELSEMAYEIVPLAALTVFAEPMPSSAASPGRILVAGSPTPSVTPLPTAVELQNAEIAALYVLHHLRADLGEQLEVARKSSEQIVVRGQVETPERKRELIAAIKDIPWVEARIQTFEEAAGHPARVKAARTEINSEPSASAEPAAVMNHFEERLANYFAERAGPTQKNRAAINRQVTQLANSVFAESSAALTNGWALRRLAERFNESVDEHVDTAAAERLREIISDHLSEISVRSRNLRVQLEPVLVAIAGTRAEAAFLPRPAAGTRRARILRLFEAIEQVQQLAYRLFDSRHPLADSSEQAASLMFGALAQLDAASRALEQDIRK